MKPLWFKFRELLDFPVFHYPETHHIFLIVLGAVAGVFGGLSAVVFRSAITFVQKIAYASDTPLGQVFFLRSPGLVRLIVAPLLAAAVIGVITWYFFDKVRGAGIPEVLESMALRDGRMVWYLAPAKLCASALSLGTIASVGREGPIVQIGSSLGSLVNNVVQLPRKHWRVLTACGGAAGLSATFNTPVGGAFFILEVVLGSFSTENFAPIVIASVTGTVVAQRFLGTEPAFQLVETFTYEHPLEFLLYAGLGVLGGFLAVILIQSVDGFREGFQALPVPDVIKPVIGAVMLLCIGLFLFPQTVGVGYETIDHLIGAKASSPEGFFDPSVRMLVLLIFCKILAVGISFGSGFSGGIFSPGLFIGSATGYLVGLVSNLYVPLKIAGPEVYAIAGMGTVFAGVANAPVSTLIIIFEMTHDYQIVIPLMISCSISTILARVLTTESIYTSKLRRKGIDIHEKPEELVMDRLTAEDVMRPAQNEPVLTSDSTFREIARVFLGNQTDHLIVVDENNHVQGIVSLHEIKNGFADIDRLGSLVRAVDVMDSDVPLIPRDTTLSETMNQLWKTHYDELPVVESKTDPTFCGVIWEHNIIGVYNREILKQKASLMKTVQQSEEEGESKMDYLELPPGYTVDQIDVPTQWSGRSLKELNIREDNHVMIVEVKRVREHGKTERLPAEAETVLTEADQLIVMGPEEEVQKLSGP